MKKDRLIQFLIICATVLCIIVLAIFRPKKNVAVDGDNYKEELILVIERLENELSYVVLEDRDVYLGRDTIPFGRLRQVAKGRLFMCFSNSTCPPCLDGAFRIVDEVFGSLEQESCLFFVCEDAPLRLYDNFMGKRLLNVSGGFNFTQEQTNYPVFFTISEFLEIDNVHIFNKLDVGRTKRFLEEYVKDLVK